VSKAALLIDPDAPAAVARARYVRITPMKARRVIDLIRGMSADQALATLQFAPQSAGEQVRKVLASAVANAENNDRLDREDLVVTEAYVDEGPTLKRFRPRAQGRAYRIRKRTCHITVVVTVVPKVTKAKAAKSAKKAAKSSPAKATTAKATTAKASPTKAAKVSTTKPSTAKPSTAEDGTDEAISDEASTEETSTASAKKTSAPDKDASGTAKRRAR